MARLTVACAFGVLVGLVVGAALGVRADEVEAAALEAGVDPTDLAGAVNTTGVEPRTYLRMVGELPSPPPPITRSVGIWDRLMQCEAGSSGQWRANTGNRYYGGLQMDMTFWRSYGGLAFAPRPDLASREQQIVVAERGLVVQGPGAWPVCSRVVGMRR